MNSMWKTKIGVGLVVGLLPLLEACSDGSPAPLGPPPGSDAAADATRPLPEAGGGDAAAAEITTVASFDATQYQLAEGLTVHKGKAYVGLAPLGTILAIDQAGTMATYAKIPPGYDKGYTLGLAFDAADNLFVLQTLNVPDAGAPAPGIYKIPPGLDGGTVSTPFATAPGIVFPNGIVVRPGGDLLVSDSATGAIYLVTSAGAVTTWKADAELAGSPACPAPLPFPIGANGIVATPTEVFVANTAKGSIVRIAVNQDGSAGAASTLVKDCAYVGLDGLARDTDGSLLVAQNGAPGRLLRVSASGTVSVLHDGAPLDGPASVVIADWNGKKSALVTSSAFFSVGIDGGAPKPGLQRYAPLP